MRRRCFVAGGLGGLAAAVLPAAAAREAAAGPDPALALLSGSRWPGARVTYGFPGAGFRWEYGTRFTAGFVPADETERALLRRVLQEWAAASGGLLGFAEVGPEAAQIRLAVTAASIGTRPDGGPLRAYTFYPGRSVRAGHIWLHAGLRALGYADGRKGGWIMRHEAGHALGLKHPHEGRRRLPADLDHAGNTVMTYRTRRGDPTPGGWPDGLPSYPARLGALDGRAVRILYGRSRAADSAKAGGGRPGREEPVRGQE
jgi:serralysin